MHPLPLARTHCRTPIYILTATPHPQRFVATTPQGSMALFFEHLPYESQREGQWLRERNRLLREGKLACPLIYEQVETESDGGWVSLTLCEMVQQMEGGRVSQLQVQDLVECGYRMNQTEFDYQPDCYMLKHILQSSMTHHLFFDFTCIFRREKQATDSQLSTSDQQLQNENESELSSLKTFRNSLAKLLERQPKISQLMFMKERPFVYQSQSVRRAQSWLDLALMFNLLQSEKVTIISGNKHKVYPVNKLNGCLNIQYAGKRCNNVSFYEGYRTDAVYELSYENLKDSFFQEGIIYQMWRQKYICVKKKAVGKGYWTRQSFEYTDVILVRPEVGKVQFINFLIGYLRYVEPVLKCLRFHPADNSLQFDFINKRKIPKSILIKFTPKYLIKDEELSMILQKSKIANATLELQKMPLSDGFLIFLANCEKLQQVIALDLSHCPSLTQSGLSMLIASPFAKNIVAFRLNGLPIPNLPLAKLKKLKQLHVNHALREQQDGQLQLSDVKLEKLQALDIFVSLRLPETLKYLTLSMEISLDSLKMFRNLGLVQLKVKLIENKKNIGSFLSGIYGRQNPAKLFQQGNSRKTLRRLDISGSSVPLKELKSMFNMDSLQSLLLQDIKRDKFMDLTLPISIMNLSLKNSLLNADQICELINKTGVFIRLNLMGTAVDDTTLQVVLRDRKYISLLEIDELQLDLKLMEKKGCFECITLQVARLIKGQGEPILDMFLLSQGVHTKEIQLSCLPKYEIKLANKILRLYNFQQTALKANITINGLSASHLISLQQKSNAVEHFSLINSKSQAHLVRIDALSTLYNRQQLGIQQFNVALHHSLVLHPDCLLEVSIRSNRLLGKQVIELLNQHVGGKLRALDFRNCLFSYREVQQELFAFPCLQSVNEGQYQIYLSEEDSCEEELQKILKFFMKLRQKQKMKLLLRAQNISEKQLYFSIMYQILHHYSDAIVSLHLVFSDIEADPHSLIFWKKVFALPSLQNLILSYHNQYEEEAQEVQLAAVFEQLATLKLHSLMIDTTIRLLVPQQLTGKELRRLSLNLSDMAITESSIYKLLKHTPNLSHLSLEMKNCSSLTSVSRISDALDRMSGLVKLSLDFQNSSIRQASALELVNRLIRNTQLERFELNLNNCSINIADLVRICQGLVRAIKFLRIFLFVLQAHPPTFAREAADLLVKGIELQFAP